MTTLTGQNRGGSNAWLWQPTEENTKYQDYLFGGQNNYMTGEVAKYLKALGYSGNAPGGGDINDQDAQSINEFLKARGLSVQTGTHQVPGYSQNTGIQRIIDANGVPVAVDARNNRYDGNDRFTDVAKVGAIAAAGYGLGNAAGLWGGAGEAGAGALGEAGLGSVGTVGSAGAGTVGGAGLGTIGASAAPGLLDQLKSSTIGKGLGQVADLVGGGKSLAGLIGAGIGAASGGGGDTVATSQSKTDPRIDPYIYGQDGYLQALQKQYQANPSGINATMQQGLDASKAALNDPAYAQSYTQMRNFGTGLLSQPMAGNPFTQGQAQMPQPNMQAGGGLLGNLQDRAKIMIGQGRGLIG